MREVNYSKNPSFFDLYKAINKKKVLEIGSNYGDITCQILRMKPQELVASEVDQDFLIHLKKRFMQNNNVSIRELNILDPKQELLIQFDTVIVKEIINAFKSDYYNSILANSFYFLRNEGSLIIIDYLPNIHIRQLVVSILMNPIRIHKYFKRYKYNIKNKKQLDFMKLSQYFEDYSSSISFYKNVDPFNEYDSLLHKLLEKIFPMKYMFIVKKIK
mgnify:CR=1 FL=1